MSFGKLYGFEGNSRSTVLRIIARENGLDLAFIEVRPPDVDAEYLKLNPLGQVPTLVRADGFVLTEVMAIAIYLVLTTTVTRQNQATKLLGSNEEEFASIIKWMSFANSEVLPKLSGWFRPYIGKDSFNKDRIDESKKSASLALLILEKHLSAHPYLVGEELTLADFFVASLISRGFMYVLDRAWRAQRPQVTRWYETVTNHPSWKAVMPNTVMIENSLEYTYSE
ncbi:elongation factor 1-gamma [Xylogone sp. PMI_703]|nr:elongation factor 1-gamma [Xylogone sp. PMI_703]